MRKKANVKNSLINLFAYITPQIKKHMKFGKYLFGLTFFSISHHCPIVLS